MRKSKKTLMGLAAVLILIFHLYIPFTGTGVEQFIYRGAFIGVDIFFLLSGESLGRRGEIKFVPFMKNRLIRVYLPFAVMAFIAALYKKWNFFRLLKVLACWEFLQKGGGAFLWFAPGIMILYLFVPLISKLKAWKKGTSLGIVLGVWLILVVTLYYGFSYSKIYILLNRLPIFFIGFYEDLLPNNAKLKKWSALIWGACLILGIILVEQFGITIRLNKPIPDMYYLMAIPLVLGVANGWETLANRGAPQLKGLKFLGGFTLELYGMQMVLGFDLEAKILRYIKIKPLTFLISSLAVILLAWAFSKLEGLTESAVGKIRKDEK